MAKGEINLLFCEVEKLLNDICRFLSEEISGGCISDNGRSLANKLIERSKQQLQTIAVVTTDASECTNEPYVDMQSYKVNQEQEDHQEVYSDVSMVFEGAPSSSPTDEEYITCPYASLPAIDIREGKAGHLYRKEKILFFEQQKKIFAAVQQSWLLIYMNEGSLKPCQTFDLTRYEAKPSTTPLKDMKKRDESFDLTSFVDSKSYHFTALTAKDMMQWVAAINKDRVVPKRSLPPVPANPTTLDEFLLESTESMNDYEPLKEYQLKENRISEKAPVVNNRKVIEKQPLPLPPRNTPLGKAQRPTPRVPSEESLGSNYDSVGPGILNVSQSGTPSSFSDDDSDTYYDNPSELKQKGLPVKSAQNSLSSNDKTENGVSINNPNSLQDDEDEIYDYLQQPSPAKDPKSNNLPNNKPVDKQKTPEKKKQNEREVGKSKPTLRPRILSLRHRRKNNE